MACGTSAKPSTTFRIGFMADTHLIDAYYVGPENTPLDTDSVMHSDERLLKARDTINRITPAVERVFVAGDIIHDYASTDLAFYDNHQTVFDLAHNLFAGFNAPVYLGFGNHDYDATQIPRTSTEQLFKAKLGVPAPYYAVDYKGWRFLHLNCFQGYTQDPTNPQYSQQNEYGSFGRTQLEWMDSELAAGLPTVLIFHIPLPFLQVNEFPDVDFFKVLDAHVANVKEIIAGHWHLWFDLGDSSGAPHMVIASTRYDEGSFGVADLTTDTHTFTWVHQELWHMQEHETSPWPASELK
jgi:hypothetical protein